MTDNSHDDHMMTSWVEREVVHSRNVVANAKVVVTFSATLAATFVAVGLDNIKESCWDEVALALMVLALAITLWVILLRSGHHRGELDETVYDAARDRALLAHWLTVVQVCLSLASIVAVIIAKRHVFPWT
jgi:hypothetical protein